MEFPGGPGQEKERPQRMRWKGRVSGLFELGGEGWQCASQSFAIISGFHL